jgi:hypothetical protein
LALGLIERERERERETYYYSFLLIIIIKRDGCSIEGTKNINKHAHLFTQQKRPCKPLNPKTMGSP